MGRSIPLQETNRDMNRIVSWTNFSVGIKKSTLHAAKEDGSRNLNIAARSS